jgi:hypothetical protein
MVIDAQSIYDAVRIFYLNQTRARFQDSPSLWSDERRCEGWG